MAQEVEVAHVKKYCSNIYYVLCFPSVMTGLSRFVGYGGALSFIYVLTLFKFIRLPFIDDRTSDITLPFVWTIPTSYNFLIHPIRYLGGH